jgi:hypothetical protein
MTAVVMSEAAETGVLRDNRAAVAVIAAENMRNIVQPPAQFETLARD